MMSPKFWLKCPNQTLCCVLWALTGLPGAACAQWVDNFNTINPAWVTDRYAPAGFQSVSFLGDNRLQITIDQTGSSVNRPPADSSSFYNVQGDLRPVGILGGWSLSAEVYVSSTFDTTTGQLVQTDLWAHSGTTQSNGAYAIIGFTNASPTDPLNPDAMDRSFRFQVFDGTTADPTSWFDVGVPADFNFDAWHTLEASGSGTTFDFSIDGVVVYTDPATIGADLQAAFIQAYNFGQTDTGGLNSYSVYWDNAIAAVPEPASFALAGGLAALGLAWTRRCGARKYFVS
jgi:hypothetical protein